jgi:hypothetical protein
MSRQWRCNQPVCIGFREILEQRGLEDFRFETRIDSVERPQQESLVQSPLSCRAELLFGVKGETGTRDRFSSTPPSAFTCGREGQPYPGGFSHHW